MDEKTVWLTDEELAEAYDQHAMTLREWIKEVQDELKPVQAAASQRTWRSSKKKILLEDLREQLQMAEFAARALRSEKPRAECHGWQGRAVPMKKW